MAHLRRWIALLTVASAALGVLAASAPGQYPGALIPYMIDVGAGWASPQGTFGHRATTGYDVAFAFGTAAYRTHILPVTLGLRL
jgi:hypothetical protein